MPNKMKPVTLKSTQKEILAALQASGYWNQLLDVQRQQLKKNPRAWLEGHPYLFSWYPSYFSDPRLNQADREDAKSEARKKLEKKPFWKFWK